METHQYYVASQDSIWWIHVKFDGIEAPHPVEGWVAKKDAVKACRFHREKTSGMTVKQLFAHLGFE